MCTPAADVERFLSTYVDRATGTVDVRRESGLWDAVGSAHAAGRRGAGQRVAVLDSGFDRNFGNLAARADPASEFSTDSLAGRHGTVVALLIHAIAPEADLRLYDVWPAAFLHRDVVAARLSQVFTDDGADLVNLSLGFDTDAAPRVVSATVDVEDLDADPASIREVLRAVAIASVRFADGGCASPCPLCSVNRGHVGPLPAVIAAAGNTLSPQCPAAHERVVGTGFEQEARSEGAIGFAKPTFTQPEQAEVVLAQPPGFAATSFAAPLLTGVAALDGAGADVDVLIGVANAMSVVQARHRDFAAGTHAPDAIVRRATELLDEYRFVLDLLPERHRHVERNDPPCATCGVLVIDLYVNAGLLALELGLDVEADRWLAAGLRICPLCPDLLLNRGAFFRHQAELADERGMPSIEHRRLSVACFRAAARRRPSDAGFVDRCHELAAEADVPR